MRTWIRTLGSLLPALLLAACASLPAPSLDAAQQAVQACDVMLVVGTAGAVYPAAGLAHVARQAGAQVLIVNPEPTELDDVAHRVLTGTSAQLLPLLFDA